MKLITKIALAVALTASSVASAAVITGSLSYDAGTDIITDTATTTTYLGWDVLAELTYAETLAEIASGATYDDYHIASQAEAYTFYHAARGSLTDNVAPAPLAARYFQFSGVDLGDGEPFGDNETSSLDSAWFLSDPLSDQCSAIGYCVGQLGVVQGVPDSFGLDENYISVLDSDQCFSIAPHCNRYGPVSWLLVSNAVSADMPEPSAILLIALGLLGMVGVNRRKIRA
jgi:hypothetical protein